MNELLNNFPILDENAEDILYRMYDIMFSRHPSCRDEFAKSRREHPQLFAAVLALKTTTSTKDILQISDNYGCYMLSNSQLMRLRHCVNPALRDVLFGEATPALIKAVNDVFDNLISVLVKQKGYLSGTKSSVALRVGAH
jgi:hemoglobin-like flavoprotein